MKKTELIVALDYDNGDAALQCMQSLKSTPCLFKVGLELFSSVSSHWVKARTSEGFRIFLDLKFHDIPTTAAKAVKAAAQLGVWMVNVHASGGQRMMVAARDILEQHAHHHNGHKPLLIGVTVLTSLEAHDLLAVGITEEPEAHVLRLTKLVQHCGLDGVVCSAREASMLRSHFGQDLCLVTPGIRLDSSPADDQKRTLTPHAAIAAGSSYLVIGRPITKAHDPVATCKAIIQSFA